MDGSVRGVAEGVYVAPAIVDYGDLLEMTRDAGVMLHLGIGTFAAASVPGTPGGGGASGGGDAGTPPTVAGDVESGGDAGGGDSPGDAGDVAGEGASGGGAGGGSSGGGGDGLPFTGFFAALAGSVGAGLAAAGTAARKRLNKSS